MGNSRRIAWLLAGFILTVALIFSIGSAYARYREEITGDFIFQAKPSVPLTIAQQQWQQAEDGYILSFSLNQEAQNCRVYLAASEGIAIPELLEISLTLPGEEQITLQAALQRIPEVSALNALFGPGYVFRFLEVETGEEQVLDLSTEIYTLKVRGLELAAEQTSLLRLFVENI